MAAIKVLETNVLHASDVLYWLDGTTAETSTEMQRLPHEVQFNLSDKPRDVQIRQAPGKTALWRRPVADIVNGEATETDKTFVDAGSFTLAGTVQDQRGLYNPRTFSVTVGAGSVPIAGQALVLYPSPQGTRFGKAGGLIATLRFATADANDGNVLLLSELTTYLQRTGLLQEIDGYLTAAVKRPGAELPRDLTALLARKIDSISSECRRAMTLAACLGDEFQPEWLAANGNVSAFGKLRTRPW